MGGPGRFGGGMGGGYGRPMYGQGMMQGGRGGMYGGNGGYGQGGYGGYGNQMLYFYRENY